MEESKQDKAFRKLATKFSVLVVDDSAFDRELIVATLKKMGFRKIQIAENGGIAMSKLDNALAVGKPFDMVFVDWKMPGRDGMSLLKLVRANYKYRKVPMFVTTGSLSSDDVEDFKTEGADYFIIKPVSYSVLKDKVLEHFLKRGTNAAA